MKKLVLFAFVAMSMGGCDHSPKSAAPAGPVQEFYGEKFDLTAAAIPVSQLATVVSGTDTVDVVVEGVIEQTCPNAGCWLNLKTDNGIQKVTTDHVFFVPVSGCENLKTKVKGKAFVSEISVDQQKHYAEEEGKSAEEIAAIVAPKQVMNLLATGVMIDGYVEKEGDGHDHSKCNHDHSAEGHDHEHEGEKEH